MANSVKLTFYKVFCISFCHKLLFLMDNIFNKLWSLYKMENPRFSMGNFVYTLMFKVLWFTLEMLLELLVYC